MQTFWRLLGIVGGRVPVFGFFLFWMDLSEVVLFVVGCYSQRDEKFVG
jgi:hypothetical protein